MLVFRPAEHLVRNSDLGAGAQAFVVLIPLSLQNVEGPDPSASGKRQPGPVLAQARAKGSDVTEASRWALFSGGSWWAGNSTVVGVWGSGEGRWSREWGPGSSGTKPSLPASPGVGPADKWATASLINLRSGV